MRCAGRGGDAAVSDTHAHRPVAGGLGGRAAARLVDVVAAAAVIFGANLAVGVLMVLTMSYAEGPVRGIDNVLFGFAAAAGVVTAHCAYEVYFTVRRGATVGKSMAGLRIVNSDSYGPLSVAAAVRRHLLLHAAPPIGGAIAVTQFEPTDVRAWAVIAAGVGCWALIGASPAWDPQRRGWHDRAAGSIVVRADSVPADTWSPPPQPPQPPSTPPSPPARPRAEPPKWGLVSDYDKPPDEQSGTHPATCPSEHRHSIANPRPSN